MPLLADGLHNLRHALRSWAVLIHWLPTASSMSSLHLLLGLWDQTTIIVCQYLGSRPTQVQELSTHVLRLFETTSRCLSIQPFQLLPSRNNWRHISLILPFLHRHWHAQWPVDVMELFLWWCCWTLFRLSRHSAWPGRGYWHYRNLIDWLIDDVV